MKIASNKLSIIEISYRIEVGSIDKGRESDCDSISQLLLVAKTNLAAVVDLGPHAGSSIQHILGSDTELGRAVGAAPAQTHSSLQSWADLLEDTASELCAIGETCVQDKVWGRVANTKVAIESKYRLAICPGNKSNQSSPLGDGRLGDIEACLVSSQPALVTHHS